MLNRLLRKQIEGISRISVSFVRIELITNFSISRSLWLYLIVLLRSMTHLKVFLLDWSLWRAEDRLFFHFWENKNLDLFSELLDSLDSSRLAFWRSSVLDRSFSFF